MIPCKTLNTITALPQEFWELNLREINGKPSLTLASTELGPRSLKTIFYPDLF